MNINIISYYDVLISLMYFSGAQFFKDRQMGTKNKSKTTKIIRKENSKIKVHDTNEN